MATRIKLRRDTAANWNTSNPILAQGETGFETDTRAMKLGDGVTRWKDLKYAVTGDLKVTGSDIHGNGSVSISSGMGDQTNWVMTVHTNNGGVDNPSDGYITSVAYDSEGNVFATGVYDTVGGAPGMFLIKTDPNGQVLFHNYYYEYYAFGFAMAVDKNDDVVFVMGEFDPSSADTLLVKVSGEDGTIIWQKYLADTDPTSDDVAICVDIDPTSNDIIIAGNTATGSQYDFWVGKFSGASGNPIWQKQYDQETMYDAASGLAVDSQGNIGIVGMTYGGEEAYLPVFKLSGADGSILWQTKIIAATSDDTNSWIEGEFMSADMCVDSNDDFYFNLTGIYCTDWLVAGVHKVNGTDGKILWGKVLNYPFFLNGSASLICDDENNVYVHTILTDFKQVNPEAGSYARWTINVTKFNTTGSRLWSRNLGREQGNTVIAQNNNNNNVFGETIHGLFGQSIAVRGDYVLIGGVQLMNTVYGSLLSTTGYDYPIIAQVNRDGTEFNVDGWHFTSYEAFPYLVDIALVVDIDNYYLNDLTENTADIDVTNGDVSFTLNTDTTALSYVSRSRVKTMTLEGSTLMLPENGTLEISRAKKGYITAIGGFDGSEGGNTNDDVWLYATERDEKGNTFAAGGQYSYFGYDGHEGNHATVFKTDSEGKLLWQAGLAINNDTEAFSIVYDQTNNTVISVSRDGAGHEGFILAYMDADTGSMKEDLTHITPDVNDNDMYPTIVRLMSNGTPVVAGYISSASDKFANVTVGAAGLTGSNDDGTLVILKNKFDRNDSTYSLEYPSEDGTWYIGSSAITQVNRYGYAESLATGVTYTGTLGSGATFNLTFSSGLTNVAINQAGTGYKAGQRIKIPYANISGSSTDNDVYVYVNTIGLAGAITALNGSYSVITPVADSTPTNVSSVALAGTGLDGWVKIDPTTNTYTFNKTSNGTYYGAGDTFKILGSDLGGTAVTHDLTITVATINNIGVGNGQVSTFTVSGTAQGVRIKLHENSSTDYTQVGTYNVYHELNNDGFIWTPNWDLSFGAGVTNSYDTVYGMTIDSNDNVIISGYSSDTGLNAGTTYLHNDDQTGFISKHNNAGVNLWTVSIDGSEGASTVWSVDTDSDDNIYSAMCNGNRENLYVTKLSPSGEFIWQTYIIMGSSTNIWSIGITDNNDIIVAGRGKNSIDLNNNYRNNNDNMYIFKFDIDGNLLFSRLLWSNKGISTCYNDNISDKLSIKGDRFSIGGYSSNPGGNADQGIIIDLPIDGTGIGSYGDFFYEVVEVDHYRYAENDNGNGGGPGAKLVTPITLKSRSHVFNSEPYVDGNAWRNVTIYGYRPHEVQTIYEPGGGDIRGVNKIVFEDGTEQTTTGQGLPQVKMSQVNTDGTNGYDYWLRLEDNGKHLYMLWQNAGVIIPDSNRLEIPVGFAFTIITAGNDTGVYSWDNDDDIYGSGFDGVNAASWNIPSYSMVTLVKIANSRWMIAGPGITTGWWSP